MGARGGRVLGALVLLAALGAAALTWWRVHAIGPVQRGEAVARAHGCFACHGPGGATGFEDPADRSGEVPPFSRLTRFARDHAEVREWILEGHVRRLDGPAGDEGEAPPPVFRMPAFRGRLSEREVGQLAAYVEAVGGLVRPPEGSPAARGAELALTLGCFQCHGPQGRADPPNPRSLKGHVPAWDGPEFLELAHDDGEIRAWVLDGAPPRLRASRVASWFLARQQLKMPAFRGRVSEDEVSALVAYIRWLRALPQ